MRVLSVRQPWAWAIIHGQKDVENRSRSLGPYRGPVAIHASLTFDEAGAESWEIRRALRTVEQGYPADDSQTWAGDSIEADHFERGAILGVVDLVDEHDTLDQLFVGDCRLASLCSPWAEDGTVHLVLANPRPLSIPYAFKGGLGLRTLPADVEAEVLRRLA